MSTLTPQHAAVASLWSSHTCCPTPPLLPPQGLANTAYAFAIAGLREEGLLAAVAEEALPRVREFSPQALAITAFAYATLRTAAPELMDAIGRRCVREAGNFTPQEIANTLWAFARMGQKLPTMLEGFADQVMGPSTEGLFVQWFQNDLFPLLSLPLLLFSPSPLPPLPSSLLPSLPLPPFRRSPIRKS